MTRRSPFLASLFAPLAAIVATPLAAQDYIAVTEEWVETTGEWVEVETTHYSGQADFARSNTAGRYVSPQHAAAETNAIAAFGAFRVLDEHTVAIVAITTHRSPADFAAVLEAYPSIDTLEFIEAPGTHDDRANLRLGRMIREAGIATRAPEGGSVRSGAVELFLAGVSREIDPASEFAVHGWLDDRGLGAQDYPISAPEHRRYLDYYAEMGMGAQAAAAFYAMTNSVPFEDALWLTGNEMREWMGEGDANLAVDGKTGDEPGPQTARLEMSLPETAAPRLVYLDLAPVLQ